MLTMPSLHTALRAAIRARSFSSDAAHRLVQQRVQGQVALLPLQTDALPSTTRVLFVTKSDAGADIQAASLPFPVSKHALQDFHAKPQEKLYLYSSSDDDKYASERVLLVGLGAAEKVDEDVLRNATHGALSALKAKRAKDVVLHVPELKDSKLKQERVVELFSQVRCRWLCVRKRIDISLTRWLTYDSGQFYIGIDPLQLPVRQVPDCREGRQW